MQRFDKIIIGAGLYGLYSALFCAKRGQRVIVLECDPTPFRGLPILTRLESIKAIIIHALFLQH